MQLIRCHEDGGDCVCSIAVLRLFSSCNKCFLNAISKFPMDHLFLLFGDGSVLLRQLVRMDPQSDDLKRKYVV